MKASQALFDFVRRWEGLRLLAYRDAGGKLTIGYGDTQNVRDGMMINIGEAQTRLAARIATAEEDVNRLVRVPLTQGQFDALIDFVYNIGGLHLSGSTLLAKLNNRDYAGAAEEFPKWDHEGGQVVPGLLKRRLAEKQMFERPGLIVWC